MKRSVGTTDLRSAHAGLMDSKGILEKRLLEQFETIEEETSKKWKALNNSKPFLLETEKLTRSLEDRLAREPKYVRHFFHLFGLPAGRREKINTFLSNAPNLQTKAILRAYVKYVARFGVIFKLNRKSPQFKPQPLTPWGKTFRVRIKNGEFVPPTSAGRRRGPYTYLFESNPKAVPSYFNHLIKAGTGKFVRIDDEDDSSLFARLEIFAYAPECLTFMVHRGERPFLFCLIGENVTNETWRVAGSAVSAFQKQVAGRSKAGRPADLRRLKKAYRLLRNKGSKKSVAVDVSHGDYAKDTSSSQSYVSTLEKSLR